MIVLRQTQMQILFMRLGSFYTIRKLLNHFSLLFGRISPFINFAIYFPKNLIQKIFHHTFEYIFLLLLYSIVSVYSQDAPVPL